MGAIRRAWLHALVWLNAHLKSASMRLTKWTGKSSVYMHPKHLVNVDRQAHWYLGYIEPGMRVLDVGCGNGMHDIRAASRKAMVVGIDYDLRQLQTGRALIAECDMTTISFLLSNAEQALPFKAGQFQLVLLLDVIEHLHNRVELLREIHRVLRPSGTVLVSAPHRNTSWKRRLRAAGLPYFADPDHKIEYTWDELQAELAAGGFEPQGKPQVIVYDTPWAGCYDFVGGLSLWAYARLMQWRVEAVQRHPYESTGWRVACRKIRSPL